MTKKLSDIVITSALRTPIGTIKGSLKELKADKIIYFVYKFFHFYKCKFKEIIIYFFNYFF